jgi:hypothetical protein
MIRLRSSPSMIRYFLAVVLLIMIPEMAEARNAAIAIFVSGNGVNGINPKIEVWIDGIQYKWPFGGDTIVTADNSAGAVQEIDVVAPHTPFNTLTVVFTNQKAAPGLNVYVKDVQVNGQSMFSNFIKFSLTPTPPV